MICVQTMYLTFDRYFCLRRITVLLYYCILLRVLPLFDTSTCSHPFFQIYWVNSSFQQAVVVMYYFKFTGFPEQKDLWQEDIPVINYKTSLVLGMYILKDSLLFDSINCSHPFFLCYCRYFTEVLEAIHHTTYCSHDYNKWSGVDSTKFEIHCVYLRTAIVAFHPSMVNVLIR